MSHSVSTHQSFLTLARGFKRLQILDPVTQCLAPRLTRNYATHVELPGSRQGHDIRTSSPYQRSSNLPSPPRSEPPSTDRFKPDAVVTLYSWPSMEPSAYKNYKYDSLSLPLRKDILHRAVIYEADNTRQGTASTKHRTQVRGSRRKVRPQKGTGRARMSDRFAPHIRGGGVTHGPNSDKNYTTELPKKVYDLAYRTALSHRYQKGEMIVLDGQVGLDFACGARWVDNFFETHAWGKGHGRTLVVATMPVTETEADGTELVSKKENFRQALEKVSEHGEVQYVHDVDVKDLLSCGRIVIEKQALKQMLVEHS